MQEDTERVDVKDFAFNIVRRIRIFPSSHSESAASFNSRTSYHLLTISNTYGLIFATWPNQGLVVLPTSEIHKHLEGASKDHANEGTSNAVSLVQIDPAITSSPIIQMHCNCDGTLLAVCSDQPTPMASIFDVRSLAPGYPGPKPVSPFCRIRLDEIDGSSLLDFQWNPSSPELFSSCCSTGTVLVISLNMNQTNAFTVQGAIRQSVEGVASCVSWSPKGKQLAIGFENGVVCQYKPQNLQQTKKWPPPSQAATVLLTRLVSICWLSTSQFFLVSTGGKPDDEQLLLIHMTVPKENGKPIYVNYEDVCFGSIGERKWSLGRYLMHHIQEWAIVLCASTRSLEVSVLGWMAAMKRWKVWDLDDNARCQLPLTVKESEECFPVGVALDRTSQNPVVLKNPEGEVVRTLPPAPILLVLSTDGVLCPFRMIHSSSDTVTCQGARKIDQWNDVKVGTRVPIPTVAMERKGSPSVLVQPVQSSQQAQPRQPTQPLLFGQIPNQWSHVQQQAPFKLQHPETRPVFQPPPPATTPASIFQQKTPVMPQQAPVFHQNAPVMPQQTTEPVIRQPQRPPEAVTIQSAQPPVSDQDLEARVQAQKNRLLRMEVINWAVEFEKELRDLKSKLAKPLPFFATKEQLADERRTLQDLEIHLGRIGREIQDEQAEGSDLRASICGQLLRADQTTLISERLRSEEFLVLLRHKPLTAKQEEEMKVLKQQYHDARTAMDDLKERIGRLELEKEQWPTTSPVISKRQTRNSLELIYRTLSNMQAIIMQQRQRLGIARRDLAILPRKGAVGSRRALDDTDALSASLMDTRLNDDSSDYLSRSSTAIQANISMYKTPYKISDSMKTMLQHRESTPRRTTVPVLKPPIFTYLKKSEAAATAVPGTTTPMRPNLQMKDVTPVRAFSATVPVPQAAPSFKTSTPIGAAAVPKPPTGSPATTIMVRMTKSATIPSVASFTAQQGTTISSKPPNITGARFTAPSTISAAAAFTITVSPMSTAAPTKVIFGSTAAASPKTIFGSPAGAAAFATSGSTGAKSIPGKQAPAKPLSFGPPSGQSTITAPRAAPFVFRPEMENLSAAVATTTEKAALNEPSASKSPAPGTVSNALQQPASLVIIAPSSAGSILIEGQSKTVLSSSGQPGVFVQAEKPIQKEETGGEPVVDKAVPVSQSSTSATSLAQVHLYDSSPAQTATVSVVASASVPTPASSFQQVDTAPKIPAATPTVGPGVSIPDEDGKRPEVDKAELKVQEAGQSVSKKPEMGQSESKPEMGQSELKAEMGPSELKDPEAGKSELKEPDMKSEVKKPELATSQLKETETEKPKSEEKEAHKPQLDKPTAAAALPLPAPSTQTQEEEMVADNGDMEAETATVTTTTAATSPAGFSFGTPTSTSAPAAPSGGGIFGGGGGGGGFFSGLGGQPSPEAAKKNVFASASGFGLGSPLGKGQNAQTMSLFGSSPVASTTSPAPAFGQLGSSGSPSIAQQGFGGFGGLSGTTQSAQGQGFGGSSGFGSKAVFGGSSAFGGSPTFGGGGGASGGSIFGGSSSFGQNAGTAGFAAFANTRMPSFGQLAGSGPTTGPVFGSTAAAPAGGAFLSAGPTGSAFGSAAPTGGTFGSAGQTGSAFGSAGQTGSIFGGSSFPGFGSSTLFQQQSPQQPSILGSQQSPSPHQSSFSQWR